MSIRSPLLQHVSVLLLLALMASVDYVTGIEIRAFPLYFLPLVLAAWHFNRRVTLLYTFVATALWAFVMYRSGREYSSSMIWVINFFTQGSAFVLVSLLVSFLRRALAVERRIGRRDELTGLPNRRDFFDRAARLTERCRRQQRAVTLGFLDLDNFKHANDERGHEHGDVILRAVAKTLDSCLRKGDLAARMGGDEFVILLPGVSREQAGEVLERVRAALEAHPDLHSCAVTCSIGAVTYPRAPDNLDRMLAAADDLMYRVKDTHKNGVLIEPAMAA